MHWFINALNILKDERGFINLGFSQGSSSSQASSGLRGIGGVNLGEVGNQAANSLTNTYMTSREALSAPFGTYMGRAVGSTVPTLHGGQFGPGGAYGDVIAPTGRYGGSAAIDTSLFNVMKDMFASSSGRAARLGRMGPQAEQGVLSAAGSEWAKYAAPVITDWQKYIATLAPSLYGQKLGFAAAPAQQAAQLLGSSSSSGSSSLGFGLGVGGDPKGSTGPLGG